MNYLIIGLALVAILLVVSLVFSSPTPQYTYLFNLLTGKYDLKGTGPLGLIKAGYDKCGDIFTIRVFHRRLTFLIGPEAHAVLFNAKDKQAAQQPVYKFTVPVFGRNILYDAPMSRMAQQLKFVKDGLSGPAMKSHGAKIVEETEKYFGAWPDQGEVSLSEVFNELTILTASRCLLGNSVREKIHREVAKLYWDLEHGMTPLTFFWPTAPTANHKKRDIARDKVVKLFSECIEERKKNEGLKEEDFVQVLIDSTYTDQSKLATSEIAGLLLACLFGGQHTSSITATWAGMLIAENAQKYLPRLLKEQDEVLEKYNGKLTWEALNEMTLLENVVRETLRMYPPLIMLMREVVEPAGLKYKDHVIPKGDMIFAVPPLAHRIESVFPDPETFNPDRWYNCEDKNKMNFISFGAGRHACLGQNFGILQVKTIWSVLLRNYDFELIDHIPPVDYSGLVAGPMGRCRARYTRKKAVAKA